jgi:hypothetical protein
MRQIPMLTTVAQNQRTWEWEFSDPRVVRFAPPLSTSEFREAFFTVYPEPTLNADDIFQFNSSFIFAVLLHISNLTFEPKLLFSTTLMKFEVYMI